MTKEEKILEIENLTTKLKDLKNLYLTDMFDLIFDTKYDKKNIQDLNHFIINVVIITTLLYFGDNICQIFSQF